MPDRRFALIGHAHTPADAFLEIAKGNVVGHSTIHKYGRNPDIDTASNFEALWNGGGDYTGHDCIVAETLETFSSSANDAGTLLSSGTLTGGSVTALIDTAATFAADGVAAGDVVINDTNLDHGIVISLVGETQINVLMMALDTRNDSGDTYRVVTKASTGTPVVRLNFLLDGNYTNETAEYIILNGTSGVDTVGTYIRHSRARCHGAATIGAITTRQKTTTANITMVLPSGYNTTMIAAYTIPAGKTGYIVKWFSALNKKQTAFSNVRLMRRPVNDVYQVMEEGSIASAGSSYVPRGFETPKDALPQMTDIKIMADTSADNFGVAGGFDLILVDN